ncbi:MAG: NADH:flavin oxidoreductase/NADH oxidase [Acetobacteraceae bacterium]|nr:NADH:flavin oxidoreductase/NADH oxidase [Acetobacteraceae bacterium]
MATPLLFQPITFRSVTARNRIAISPMCQYSAHDGLGDDWHIQNLGAKAMAGPGFVFTEATHVSDIGRITLGCLGLWTEEHKAFLKRLVALVTYGGGVPGIQVAHAGRKASSQRPWEGGKALLPAEGGWVPWAPSPIPFHGNAIEPHAMSADEIRTVIGEFAATARLAREAGFQVIELHGAHGYLLHSMLSPVSNHRNDGYGGDLKGRATALMEAIDAVRGEWPDELPLFLRLSCTDYMAGGLSLDDAVELAGWLRARGDVDLIDCSSGGVEPIVRIPSIHPGYQVPFAERIRAETGMPTGAVGMIRSPEMAAEIVANGRADLVFVGRAALADPGWPLRAAASLGVKLDLVPQYQRGHVGLVG